MLQVEIELRPWERRRLRELRDQGPSPRIIKRAMCLLLSADGQRATDIARVTGLSLDGITDIRKRWHQRGLKSITDRPRAGRPPLVTDEYRRELRRALRRNPLNCGYVFTVWSIARLNTYLYQRTGIRIGDDWLRRLVHAENFVVGRPKHTLRGRRNERKYQRTRRRLDRLKRGPCSSTRPTNSGTPMPPSSICCRTWRAAGCPRAASGR